MAGADRQYSLEIKRSAEREMDRLPADIRRRVSEAILVLESNPRPVGSRKLQAGAGFRLRVGDYRVLYTVDDVNHQVTIYSVAHRREAYGPSNPLFGPLIPADGGLPPDSGTSNPSTSPRSR